MNYYERHLGDYARDTGHLTPLEHGVYTLLLDRYYATEAPIPEDQPHRICRARSKDERDAVDAVLAEFFTLQDGAWHNARCDAEIEEYRETEPEREAKRENAKERQRRFRERRAKMFEALREHDIVPPYDASMADLERLMERVTSRPVTRDVTHPVTRDETANQTPDTRHQTPERGARKGARSQSVQFSTWLASLPEGEDAIRPDDPVFQFAADAGIPEDMLALAWSWFERTYTGSRKSKRYTDWRQVFRNAVEGNWPKVWRFTPDGQCLLTSEGEMLRRALEAEARRAAA